MYGVMFLEGSQPSKVTHVFKKKKKKIYVFFHLVTRQIVFLPTTGTGTLPMCFAMFMNSSPSYIFRLIFFTYTNFGLFPILIFTYKKNHGARHKQQHQKCPHFEDKVEQGRNENAKTRLKRLCMRGSNMVRMKKWSALKLVVMSNKAQRL